MNIVDKKFKTVSSSYDHKSVILERFKVELQEDLSYEEIINSFSLLLALGTTAVSVAEETEIYIKTGVMTSNSFDYFAPSQKPWIEIHKISEKLAVFLLKKENGHSYKQEALYVLKKDETGSVEGILIEYLTAKLDGPHYDGNSGGSYWNRYGRKICTFDLKNDGVIYTISNWEGTEKIDKEHMFKI